MKVRCNPVADIDFETYSEAGFIFNKNSKVWSKVISGSKSEGISIVGAPFYSEHESTEVLSLAYDLKDSKGPRLWIPKTPRPIDLFEYISQGGILEAWNSSFEWYIWNNVCYSKMGWPKLPYTQLKCAMSKARSFCLPMSLAKTGQILNILNKKETDGKRLIDKFCKPNAKKGRTLINDDPLDALNLYSYNIKDIKSENEASVLMPNLSDYEHKIWLLDQKINFNGVFVDVNSLEKCISILEQTYKKYIDELILISNGQINSPFEVKKISEWLLEKQVVIPSLNKECVDELLNDEDLNLPEECRRILQIRRLLGSISVKKLETIKASLCKDGRLKDLFVYHGADTGRWSSLGAQVHNLPNSGLKLKKCLDTKMCGKHYKIQLQICPWCNSCKESKIVQWDSNAMEDAFTIINKNDLNTLEHFFGDSVGLIGGCIRGVLIAKDGYDLICSDFSSIESVILAVLADEQWRIEVFKTHGKMYEMSASKITGIPFNEFLEYKEKHGEHHPMRKSIGKLAELSSGFQGSVNAWKKFGADKFFKSDEEIKTAVYKWRDASKNIVSFWKNIERAAISACRTHNTYFICKKIAYICKDDILFCVLPSGRELKYHSPKIETICNKWGYMNDKLSYMGWKSAKKGWSRIDTYGGRLVENLVQGTARDILANSLKTLDDNGYSIVLHIHDEIIAEIPRKTSSIERYEQLMAIMPHWAKDWPIFARGGWIGKRYRKD